MIRSKTVKVKNFMVKNWSKTVRWKMFRPKKSNINLMTQ